jgi:hypothetical protein
MIEDLKLWLFEVTNRIVVKRAFRLRYPAVPPSELPAMFRAGHFSDARPCTHVNTGPLIAGNLRPSSPLRVAEAALIACLPDYEACRPVMIELKRRHSEDGRRVRGGRPSVSGRPQISSLASHWFSGFSVWAENPFTRKESQT